MTAEKEKTGNSKPRLLKICATAALIGLVVGLGANMYYMQYQSSKRADERVGSWMSAYKQASGGPAKAWFTPEGTDDCVTTLNRLGSRGFTYQVDGKVLDGIAQLNACQKPGSHAITYWR